MVELFVRVVSLYSLNGRAVCKSCSLYSLNGRAVCKSCFSI